MRNQIRTRLKAGARVPALRAVAKEFRMSFEEAAAYLDECAPDRVREEMLVGIFSLAKWDKPVRGLPWERLAAWIQAADCLEVCDQLGANIAAVAIHAQPELRPRLRELTDSGNMWERRMALATAAAMNQGGRLHVEFAEELCVSLERDPELMIRKCVDWARRELTKASMRAALG